MNENTKKNKRFFKSLTNDQGIKLEILNLIKKYGPITKRELSDKFGINITTINRIVNNINNNSKLINEIIDKKTTGGRRASLYDINTKSYYVIGIDVGGENFRIILTDLVGNVIEALTEKTVQRENDPDYLLEKILDSTKRIIDNSSIVLENIIGGGVSISTSVLDFKEGKTIFNPNISSWNNFNIKNSFEERLKIPFIIDDSTRSMAVAEKEYGIAKNYDNFFFVGLGGGIGIGVFIDGKIYRGSRGVAGELGHITVLEDGPICSCGNRGCLEAIASSFGIKQRAKEGIEKGIKTSLESYKTDQLSVKIIAGAAKEGDKFAYNLLIKTGEYIGTAIATALNLFGSDLVVLGGGISDSGKILTDTIKRIVKQKSLDIVSKQVVVVKTKLGEYNAALGIATSFINMIFCDNAYNIFDIQNNDFQRK